MKEATELQKERQTRRKRNGQYTKYPPCEVCGKVVGARYFSDPRQSGALGVHGLTLCGKCSDWLGAMSDEEALAVFEPVHICPECGVSLEHQPDAIHCATCASLPIYQAFP